MFDLQIFNALDARWIQEVLACLYFFTCIDV